MPISGISNLQGKLERRAPAERAQQPSALLQSPDACIRHFRDASAETVPITFVIEPDEPETVTVTTQLKEDFFGIKNLIGQYTEIGDCNSRKCFQKLRYFRYTADQKAAGIFLYFWDYRDGPNAQGWWFGSEVGGSEVWARGGSADDHVPPRTGWRIPFDADYKSGALCVDIQQTSKHSRAAASRSYTEHGGKSSCADKVEENFATGAELEQMCKDSAVEEILMTAIDEVQTLETAVEASLAASREAGEEALKDVYDKLMKQKSASAEMHEVLNDHIVESRRVCPRSLAVTADLPRLHTRIKAVESSLVSEIYRVAMLVHSTQKRRISACTVDIKEQQKRQEMQDLETKCFQDAFPHSMDVVAAAEDAVEAVSLLAAPLLAELPEEEDLTEPPVAEIEDATSEAMRKLSSARVEVANQLVIVGAYATRVKESAMSEYGALKARLQKAREQLEVFLKFRQGFRARVEAKSRLLEMADVLSAAELEVEKVIMALQSAENGQVGREESEAAVIAMRSAESGVSAVLLSVNSMLQGAVGIARASFREVKDRACKVQSKINMLLAELFGQNEALQAQKLAQAADREIVKVESALKCCQEVELPHITSTNELASKVIGEAIRVLRTKLAEVNAFKSEAVKPAAGAISDLLKRAEGAAAKVMQFKRDAHQRKLAAILKEVVEAVACAEAAVAALAYASHIFLSGEFKAVSLEVLRQASESSLAAEKQADMACAQARQIMSSKQRLIISCDGAADLHQLQGRLNAVQHSLAKHRRLVVMAERVISCKQLLLEETQRLDDAEAATQRAEVASESKADRGNENLPPECIDHISASLATVESLLKPSAIVGDVDDEVASLSFMDGPIERLKKRKQLIQERFNLVAAKTKSLREQRRCENIVADSIHKIELLEKLLEQVHQTKESLMRNAESLPLPQATTAIQAFEASAAEAQTLIEDVQRSLAAKSREFRCYACQKTVSTATLELDKLAGSVTAAAVKLEASKAAVQECKVAVQAQDVASQVAVAESAVIRLDKAASKSNKFDERLSKLTKEAQVQVDTARISLVHWLQEAHRCGLKMDIAQHLQVKLTTVAAHLAKARKASLEQEHEHLANNIITGAKELEAVADECVRKAKEACSPLAEHEGEEFLAYGSLKLLACALTEHAKITSMPLFEVLRESIPDQGKKRISKECFVACLDALAEMTGHSELCFTEERKLAMFANLDVDQDGVISLTDLRDTFLVKDVCNCHITNRPNASNKCAPKKRPMRQQHATSGDLQRDQRDGGTSVECVRCLPRPNGRFGFVSTCKYGCNVQVEAYSPFNSCVVRAQGALAEANDDLCQARNKLKAKEVELAKLGRTGPAGTLQQDLLQIRQKVIASLAALKDLRKKVERSKDRVTMREQSEQMAYEEVRERRQAAVLMRDLDSILTSLETFAQELSKAAHPMTALATRAQLDAFPRPLDLWDNVEHHHEELLQAAAEVRSLIAKRNASIMRLNPQGGPLLDASVQLEQVETKVKALEAKAENSAAAVQSKCHAIANAWSKVAVDAMRANILRRGLTPEGLFQELAEANDCIAEDAFFSHLASLQELASVRRDHIQVLCWYWRVMDGGDGISRHRFMSLVQRYMVVLKAIAVTDDVDVARSRALRKAKVDEIMEVLEAPNDSNDGLVRIRGRLLTDSLVGWITFRGCQGTFFLKETGKPQYQCKQDTELVKSFACDALETVRILREGEVFEVLEGPKTVECLPVKRVHGKACSDGAVGWFSITDEKGGTLAELETKTYECVSVSALTDGRSPFESSVFRTVEVGEVLEVLEGPLEIAGLTRIRGRLLKDGVEGWLTARDSFGTTYASVSTRHYRIARKMPLHTGFETTTDDSSCVRTLVEGELLQVLEPARDKRVPPSTCLRVAAVVDGLIGWIRAGSENVEKWSSACTCLETSPLLHGPSASAVVLRELEPSETVDLLSNPHETIGEFARVCARKDGIIGWVAIQNDKSCRFRFSGRLHLCFCV